MRGTSRMSQQYKLNIFNCMLVTLARPDYNRTSGCTGWSTLKGPEKHHRLVYFELSKNMWRWIWTIIMVNTYALTHALFARCGPRPCCGCLVTARDALCLPTLVLVSADWTFHTCLPLDLVSSSAVSWQTDNVLLTDIFLLLQPS